MATTQRVKVQTFMLIERIEQSRAEAEREYVQAMVKYERDCERYLAAVTRAVDKYAKALPNKTVTDLRPSRYDHWLSFRVPVTAPEKPRFDISPYDRDIRLLGMASDGTITISTGDRWNRYL